MTERTWQDDLRAALDELAVLTSARIEDLDGDRGRIVAASRDSNADDEHDPEGQTIAWDREQTGALLAEARARLDEVASARDRVDSGWDGTCTGCGQAIPLERLLARPTTSQCVSCA